MEVINGYCWSNNHDFSLLDNLLQIGSTCSAGRIDHGWMASKHDILARIGSSEKMKVLGKSHFS